MSTENKSFEDAARNQRVGLLSEVVAFLMENKKWWLLPIFIALLFTSLLVVVGSSGAAPFIYTLFERIWRDPMGRPAVGGFGEATNRTMLRMVPLGARDLRRARLRGRPAPSAPWAFFDFA